MKHKIKVILSNPYIRLIILIFAVFFFLLGLETMGEGFKAGENISETLLATIADPISALFIGILVTAIVQSSALITSIIVALCASGAIPIPIAIPAIMGANIGTTATNTLVSFGHITRKDEFKSAFSGAVVHGVFNILAVIVIFPLEMLFRPLYHSATLLTNVFVGVGGIKFVSPIKIVTQPVIDIGKDVLYFCTSEQIGIIFIVFGLIILFFSLGAIVSCTRFFVASSRGEKLIKNYLFGMGIKSFVLGLVLTIIVQSISVTTSLIIPLVGAGVLSLEKIYSYVLGANIGSTVTAIFAGFAIGVDAGITIAFVHLMFNVFGVCIFYPLRRIPISFAKKLGDFAFKKKRYAIIYIITIFYLLPIIYILLRQVI